MQSYHYYRSSSIENVLLRSKRRCAVCFAEGVAQPKEGAIVHLDRNSTNDEEGNLVFLCLEHHNAFDGKELDLSKIREYRDKLYAAMEVGDSSRSKTPALLFEERVAEMLAQSLKASLGEDLELYRRKILPSKSGAAWREVDLAAELTVAGCLKLLIVIEVKLTRKKLGISEVHSFWALLQDVGANKGMLVTNGDFTPDAIHFASWNGIALLTVRPDSEHPDKDVKMWTKPVIS